jgi:hypothetical protein
MTWFTFCTGVLRRGANFYLVIRADAEKRQDLQMKLGDNEGYMVDREHVKGICARNVSE